MNTYVLDKNKLKEGMLLCLEYYTKKVSEEKIKEQYEKQKKEVLVYYADSYIYFDWYYDERENIIKEKTKYWKLKNNEYTLQDGEYIIVGKEEVFYKEKPISEFPMKWNSSINEWEVDSEKQKEILEKENLKINKNYFSEIDRLKEEVLTDGFDFNGHRQKCRDKDLVYINSSIMTLSSYKEMTGIDMKMIWTFSDEDHIEVSLNDLKMIQLTGTPFIEKVFAVEKIFKKMKPFKITKKDFVEMLKKVTLADDNIRQKHIEVLDAI